MRAEGPLFDPELAPTLVITSTAPDDVQRAWLAAGAKVLVVEPDAGGRGVHLPAALSALGELGVLQALVEGGGQLIGSLVEAGLVDRLVTYVAPGAARARWAPGIRSVRTRVVGRCLPAGGLSPLPHRRRCPDRLGPGAPLMFTGIVEELGTVRTFAPAPAP